MIIFNQMTINELCVRADKKNPLFRLKHIRSERNMADFFTRKSRCFLLQETQRQAIKEEASINNQVFLAEFLGRRYQRISSVRCLIVSEAL